MSSTEDTFISHLIEMRDRLLRAVIAVVVLFVCLFPWAQDLYALLAKPMLAALPQGGQMIATEVTTPFFVPIKVTLMTPSCWRCRGCSTRPGPLPRRASISTKNDSACRW